MFLVGSLLAPEGRIGKLADDALVCRGGACKVNNFSEGTGIISDPTTGKLNGVSVTIGKSAETTLADLTSRFKQKEFGFTTVGEIQKLGGKLSPDAIINPKNPYHSLLNGLTAKQLEQIFRKNIRTNKKR